jgi:hypothetical protein
MRVQRWLLVCVVAAAAAGAGCGGDGDSDRAAPRPASGAAPWPAPSDPLVLTRRAGLKPERSETLEFHVHAHLDVFVNGKPVPVPAGIGINVDDPGVQHDQPGGPQTAQYGGIRRCDRPCISPLHTHDFTGILHTESPTPVPNRLGQFFTEWDVRLDSDCVGGYCRPESDIRVYVDGRPFTSDPADITLTDLREIAIVIGTPPDEIPDSADFSGA